MNLKELKEAAKLYREMAKRANTTVEKCVEMVAYLDEMTTTIRSTNEERLSVMDALRSLVEEHTEENFDPRDVVVQVGLKQSQADRAFVRHHMARMRLEYAGNKAA